MIATHRLADIDKADILLIPGATATFINVMKNGETINHIRRIDATTKWTTSVFRSNDTGSCGVVER
jgi:putative intracellular protease/amidase